MNMVDIGFPSATLSFMSLRLGEAYSRQSGEGGVLQIPGFHNEVAQKEILYELRATARKSGKFAGLGIGW